jgi:ATP-dependent Lhr-like helicase
VFISRRNGRRLTVHPAPDDPDLPACLAPLRHLLTRRFNPLPRIRVEEINDSPASGSPYLDVLRTCFDAMVEHRQVVLYRP